MPEIFSPSLNIVYTILSTAEKCNISSHSDYRSSQVCGLTTLVVGIKIETMRSDYESLGMMFSWFTVIVITSGVFVAFTAGLGTVGVHQESLLIIVMVSYFSVTDFFKTRSLNVKRHRLLWLLGLILPLF